MCKGALFQILTLDVVYPNDAGDRLVFRSSARELTLFYLFWKDLGPQDWGRGYLRPRQVYRDAEQWEWVVEFANVEGGLFDLRHILNTR